MMWLRRIAFFLLLNIVVMLTLSLVLNLLGVGNYITRAGMNYSALMVFCLVWGMGGALISLMLSKVMAKWTMGLEVIGADTRDPQAREILETVHRLSRSAGLTSMPEVAVYNSPELNAFATGPTRNNSLVAVSSGLLQSMDKGSIEGVLGHEVSHIANGDMVTMTLIQGVVNAFVMALARIIAFAIDNFLRSDKDDSRGGLGPLAHMLVVFVLELILFIPGSMVVAWFSRYREFRADQGGAQVAGRDKMISALRALQRATSINENSELQSSPAFANMKIASNKRSGLALLMSTHPPLDERIERLEKGLLA